MNRGELQISAPQYLWREGRIGRTRQRTDSTFGRNWTPFVIGASARYDHSVTEGQARDMFRAVTFGWTDCVRPRPAGQAHERRDRPASPGSLELIANDLSLRHAGSCRFLLQPRREVCIETYGRRMSHMPEGVLHTGFGVRNNECSRGCRPRGCQGDRMRVRPSGRNRLRQGRVAPRPDGQRGLDGPHSRTVPAVRRSFTRRRKAPYGLGWLGAAGCGG